MSEAPNTSAVRSADVVPVAERSPPAVPSDDDAAVLAMVGRGDLRGAVVALMQQHGDAVYAFSLRILRDPDRAADVQQQVFLEAYRDLRTFAGKSALRTWLFSIARHRSLDAIKTHVVHGGERHVSDTVLELMPRAAPAIEDQLDQARLAPALEECLGLLTEKARVAVLLRYVHDVSYEAMSEILDEKANTLQARVARAFPALRACLERKGVSP